MADGRMQLHDAGAWYNLGLAGGGTVAGRVYSKTQCYERALDLKPDDDVAPVNLVDA